MSVAHRKDKPQQAVDEKEIVRIVEEKAAGIIEEKTAEIAEEVAESTKGIETLKAAGESTAALLSLSFKTQIVTDRAAKTNAITDAMILASTELVTYDDYKDGHDYNTIGEIIKSGGLYFEIVAKHKSNAVAYPVATTFAYYRHIELSAAGTAGDPIPYPETAGVVVAVKNGTYYSYKGAVYLAKADMPNCVWPPNTAGLWQWEKVS